MKEAQQRRWAKIRGEAGPSTPVATPEPPKAKRRISEEGMKRIIAATKKRWRLQKAQAAKAQPSSAKKTAAKGAAAKKAPAKAPQAKVAKRNKPAKRAVRKSATAPAPTETQVVG